MFAKRTSRKHMAKKAENLDTFLEHVQAVRKLRGRGSFHSGGALTR